MTDNELKTQVALGLIDPKEIGPNLIWSIVDSELLHSLAEIYFNHLLKEADENPGCMDNTYWINSPERQRNKVYMNFLSNPHTSVKTRAYINSILLKIHGKNI